MPQAVLQNRSPMLVTLTGLFVALGTLSSAEVSAKFMGGKAKLRHPISSRAFTIVNALADKAPQGISQRMRLSANEHPQVIVRGPLQAARTGRWRLPFTRPGRVWTQSALAVNPDGEFVVLQRMWKQGDQADTLVPSRRQKVRKTAVHWFDLKREVGGKLSQPQARLSRVVTERLALDAISDDFDKTLARAKKNIDWLIGYDPKHPPPPLPDRL